MLVLLGIILGLAISVIFAILYLREKEEGEGRIDYKFFFILGIVLAPFGLISTAMVSMGYIGIMGIGIIYLIFGLVNHKKWAE